VAATFTRGEIAGPVYGAALLRIHDSKTIALEDTERSGESPDLWILGTPPNAKQLAEEISDLRHVDALRACFDSPSLLRRRLFTLPAPTKVSMHVDPPRPLWLSNNVFCPPPTYP
jgi:hypothetical protein